MKSREKEYIKSRPTSSLAQWMCILSIAMASGCENVIPRSQEIDTTDIPSEVIAKVKVMRTRFERGCQFQDPEECQSNNNGHLSTYKSHAHSLVSDHDYRLVSDWFCGAEPESARCSTGELGLRVEKRTKLHKIATHFGFESRPENPTYLAAGTE